MDQLAYVCFLSHDSKSCGTLWPHCLFIVGQSIILGNFFPKFHCWLYCRLLIYKYDHVGPSGLTMMAVMNNNEQFFFKISLAKWILWNPSVSRCNGVMVWCNCYGVCRVLLRMTAICSLFTRPHCTPALSVPCKRCKPTAALTLFPLSDLLKW